MNHLDPHDARALLDDTERQTRGAVQPPTHLLFTVWGVAWLVGYLAMWLSTVDQDPYRGPAPWAFLVFGAGLLTAAGVVLGAVDDAGIPDAATGLLGAAMPALLVAVVAAVGVWTGPTNAALVVGVGGALAFAAGTLARRHSSTSAA